MRLWLVGAFVPVAALSVLSCSGDPTENLRGGVAKLNATPSQVFLQQGLATNVDVTATDEQGNLIVTKFTLTSVGSGITVQRDLKFRNIFTNDTVPGPPTFDSQFRYRVTANSLAASSFTVEADGKTIEVPVSVTPDPTLIPQASVTTTGPAPQDTITLTVPAPYEFQGSASVAFDVGNAVVVGRSSDGTSIKLFALPGSTGVGAITGVNINYLPTISLATTTDTTAPVAVNTTVVAASGTDDPTTAPDATVPALGEQSGFIDAGGFTGADLTADAGLAAQYYKLTVTEAGDYSFEINWGNDADIDFAVCSDVTCSDGGTFPEDETFVDQPEVGHLTLTPGTYYFVAVFFDVGPSGQPPPWISLRIGAQPSAQ